MKSYFKFLRRNKAYTIIDVLGLALSMMFIIIIGAYTWQETHLDTQHTKADRMYVVGIDWEGDRVTTGSHWRMIRRLMDRFPEIESGTALVASSRTLDKTNGEPVVTEAMFVDSTFFNIFDFELLRGNKNTVLASPNSVVITENYARRIWGDEDPMGKTLVFNVNEDPVTVGGIMAPLSNTSLRAQNRSKPIDMLIPFENIKHMNSSMHDERMGNATGAEIILLAKEGYDLSANEQQYTDFAKDFYWILSMPDKELKLKMVPFKELYFSGYTGEQSLARGDGKMVKLLFVTGLVILLFALMNYINLTVALSGYRAKEMATRRLLGRSRAGIIAKLIGESTLLCIVSFVIGAGLGHLALPYAENLLSTNISVRNCITPATVSILAGIILLMGVMAGIIPAILISSTKPIDVVRGTFRRRTKMVFSKIFIVIQNVITITMIAAAMTMFLQINHLIEAPLGYESDHIMCIDNGGDKEKILLLADRVAKLPGVEAVSFSCGYPLQGGNNNTLILDNRTISFQTFVGDENFMKIFGLELERDNHTSDANKYYINRQALNELGLSEDAEYFEYYGNKQPISGIIKDFHIRTILDEQHPLILEIRSIDNFWPWGILVKVNGDEAETYNRVKEIYKDIYQFDYTDSQPYMNQMKRAIFRSQSNLATIVAIFAAIAIIISMLGLVAMSTYFVQQRRREIAVKKVLGCDRTEMLRRLVLSFLSYVVIAFVIAVPLIYYLMHSWLMDYSYRISLHWWIYAVAGACCLAVSVLSVYLQSRRAANENPIKALYQN